MKGQSREDEIRKRWNDCQGLTEAEIEALLRLLDEARREHSKHEVSGCWLEAWQKSEQDVQFQKKVIIEMEAEVVALKAKLAPMEAHIGLQDDELIAKEAFCKKAEAEVAALKANLKHHWELVKDLKARLSESEARLDMARRALACERETRMDVESKLKSMEESWKSECTRADLYYHALEDAEAKLAASEKAREEAEARITEAINLCKHEAFGSVRRSLEAKR